MYSLAYFVYFVKYFYFFINKNRYITTSQTGGDYLSDWWCTHVGSMLLRGAVMYTITLCLMRDSNKE